MQLAPIIVVILSVVGMALANSILANIEIRHDKLCQLDNACWNCSRTVQEALTKRIKVNMDQSEGDCPAVPARFVGAHQYCCQLWAAFDCRSQVAVEQCTFFHYIKYRRNMIKWANDLMLANICTEFDYNSQKCLELKQKSEIFDEFSDFWFDRSVQTTRDENPA